MIQSDSQTESQIDMLALKKSSIGYAFKSLDLYTTHLYQQLVIDQLIQCKDSQQIRGLKLILKQLYKKESQLQLEQLQQLNNNKNDSKTINDNYVQLCTKSNSDFVKNIHQFQLSQSDRQFSFKLKCERQFSFKQQFQSNYQNDKQKPQIRKQQNLHEIYQQRQQKSSQQEMECQLVYPIALYMGSLLLGVFIGCGVFLFQAKFQPQQQDYRFGNFSAGKWTFLSFSTILFSFAIFCIYDQAIKSFLLDKTEKITEWTERNRRERELVINNRKARKMKQKKQQKELKKNRKQQLVSS